LHQRARALAKEELECEKATAIAAAERARRSTSTWKGILTVTIPQVAVAILLLVGAHGATGKILSTLASALGGSLVLAGVSHMIIEHLPDGVDHTSPWHKYSDHLFWLLGVLFFGPILLLLCLTRLFRGV